jgi:hypothetical protein
MTDEKKTYTISEELADELRQETVRFMCHYDDRCNDYMCEFCLNNADEAEITHDLQCLGQN